MTAVHLTVGLGVCAATLGVGVWGAWLWWRSLAAPAFWTALRATQALLGVQVLLGLLLLAAGHEPSGDLHVLYGVLPLAVMFVAEQLRIASAQTVLDALGHTDARAVGALPESEQRTVVLAIVRRETGVMAAASLVSFLLVLRAADVAGGLPF